MKKIILISAAVIMATNLAFSQGTAINDSGTEADSSAILDISSPSQGILIPRMTEAQKNAVPRPAPSLMIYQTDGILPGYYFNAGDKTTKNWVYIGADDLGSHTATDSLNMSMNKIVNLATCTHNYDAANKLYVDNQVGAGGSGGGVASIPTMLSNESPGLYNIADAVHYCDTLNESSYSDWRMPAADELAYFFGSSTSANFLWTKTLATGREDASIQYFISARLSDGKFRNGYDLSSPFVGKGVSGSTNGAGFNVIGTINPVTPGNWLMVSNIYLSGLMTNVSYCSAFRIKFNYANGSNAYSPSHYACYGNPISFSWDNTNNPVAMSSLVLEGGGVSVSGAYSYGTLTISGYETPPQAQKDGNTLYCRCVR